MAGLYGRSFASQLSAGLQTIEPGVDLVLCLVPGTAVFCLHQTDDLIALAGNLVPLIAGDVAPFFLCLATQLFPITFDLVPIYGCLLC